MNGGGVWGETPLFWGEKGVQIRVAINMKRCFQVFRVYLELGAALREARD